MRPGPEPDEHGLPTGQLDRQRTEALDEHSATLLEDHHVPAQPTASYRHRPLTASVLPRVDENPPKQQSWPARKTATESATYRSKNPDGEQHADRPAP